MTAPRDPGVAFGLACLTAGLDARAGSSAIANRSDLVDRLAALPAGDQVPAMAALLDFAWAVRTDPAGAGQRLLDWVASRHPAPPPPDHDWQQRADLA